MKYSKHSCPCLSMPRTRYICQYVLLCNYRESFCANVLLACILGKHSSFSSVYPKPANYLNAAFMICTGWNINCNFSLLANFQCSLKDQVVQLYLYETVHYVHFISIAYPYFSVSCCLYSGY